MIINGFKCCIKCQILKEVEFFYKSTALRKNDDGLDYYCKVCRNSLVKKTFKNNKTRCSMQECDKPNYARHLCRMHYDKLVRQEKKIRGKVK
jgi:hypothetical protein